MVPGIADASGLRQAQTTRRAADLVPGGIATGGNAAAGYGVDAVFCGGLVARAVITAGLKVRAYTEQRCQLTYRLEGDEIMVEEQRNTVTVHLTYLAVASFS